MPIQIKYQDIITTNSDIIVNPTDALYSGSGGADYAIHRAAGSKLDEACSLLKPLSPGQVEYTDAFDLNNNRYIIHTFGPVWNGGNNNEVVILRSCYLNALFLVQKLKCESISFPLISSGTFGFPKDKVLRIAIDAISDFLAMSEVDIDVTICIVDRYAFSLSTEIALKEYLFQFEKEYVCPSKKCEYPCESICLNTENCCDVGLEIGERKSCSWCKDDLSNWLKHQDDTFAVTLLKLIDKKGMTDVECYKKSNISRKTFHKIRNDGSYKPSKQTVIAFAIGLQLSLEETEMLLKTVGFSLSHSYTFDIIIEFFISQGIYDIYEINATLYQYDQVCLGC